MKFVEIALEQLMDKGDELVTAELLKEKNGVSARDPDAQDSWR